MLDASQDYARRLRTAFGAFATGVTVVTLRDSTGAATGLTVNSFSSLSLEPALLMFSVGRKQNSLRWLEMATDFNVNVLSADQEHLAWQFARPADDKFAGVDWFEGDNGVPFLDNAIARFQCRTWQIMDGGDHRIVVGEIDDFAVGMDHPLLFHRGRMGRFHCDEIEAR